MDPVWGVAAVLAETSVSVFSQTTLNSPHWSLRSEVIMSKFNKKNKHAASSCNTNAFELKSVCPSCIGKHNIAQTRVNCLLIWK